MTYNPFPTPLVSNFDPEPELFDVQICASEQRLWRKLQGHLNTQYRNFVNVYLQISNSPGQPVAFQHATITADMLSSSDDPTATPVVRSVLQTKSQSLFEFNWWHAGGASLGCTVQLNAGGGVPAIKVIINPDHMGSDMIHMTSVDGTMVPESEVVARPYNAAGTALQFGTYQVVGNKWEFYPVSILIAGATMYLSEVLPMVNIL